MATILICGHRSYAARGLEQTLKSQGHSVLCFSRGELKRDGNVITGPVYEIDKNPNFSEHVDVVINFILLHQCSVEDNEKYIKVLLRFCKNKGISRLIQISSISSYPNNLEVISENTPTEEDIYAKGPYGSIKAIADKVLEEARKNMKFEILFVRPGYIVASDNPHPYKGVAKFFTKRFAVLIGDKKATLPCIRREVLHLGLAEIIIQENPLPVYLMIEERMNTKYSYFKSQTNAFVLPIPRWLVFFIADAAKLIHVIDMRKNLTIKGVFKRNHFDNNVTKDKIKAL